MDKKLYCVTDKISNEVVCYVLANNDKDFVRNLVYARFFEINRKQDIEIREVGRPKKIGRKVDLEKVIKELAFQLEDKAEKIEGTKEEVEEKIKKTIEEAQNEGKR